MEGLAEWMRCRPQGLLHLSKLAPHPHHRINSTYAERRLKSILKATTAVSRGKRDVIHMDTLCVTRPFLRPFHGGRVMNTQLDKIADLFFFQVAATV